MAVFIRLKSIDFDDPATATFVFETDDEDGDEIFRFTRELAGADGTDASVAATATALAADLRVMAAAAEQYAAAVTGGATKP